MLGNPRGEHSESHYEEGPLELGPHTNEQTKGRWKHLGPTRTKTGRRAGGLFVYLLRTHELHPTAQVGPRLHLQLDLLVHYLRDG